MAFEVYAMMRGAEIERAFGPWPWRSLVPIILLLVAACASTTPYDRSPPSTRADAGHGDVRGDALAYLERIQEDPGDFDAYYNLAIWYQRQGDVERAVSAYEKALLLEPKHVPAAVNLAGLHRERGNDRKAITVLRDLFDSGVDDPRARTDLAILYRRVGEYERSLEESREILARFGLVYGAKLNAALVYHEQERYEMALTLLREMTEEYPQESRVHFSIAQTLQALDNLPGAEQEYQRAVSADNSAFEAWNNIGVIRLLRRDFAAAETAFTKAVSANVNFADGYTNLGIAHRNQEEYREAVQAYRRALEIRPNDRDTLYNLALLYDDYWDRPTLARRTWNRYLERFSADLTAEDRDQIETRLANLAEREEKMRAEAEKAAEQEAVEAAAQPATAPAESTAPAGATAATTTVAGTASEATDTAGAVTQPSAAAAPSAGTAPATPAAAGETGDPAAQDPAAGVGEGPFAETIIAFRRAQIEADLAPTDPARLEQLIQRAYDQLREKYGDEAKIGFKVDVDDAGKPKLKPTVKRPKQSP